MNLNRRLKPLAQLICSFALLFALGAAVPACAQVTTLVTFDRTLGQIPESIAIDKTGNIYVSWVGAHAVEKVTLDGAASTLAVLPSGKVLGVTTDATGNVYAILNGAPADKGVWLITPDGAALLYANIPGAIALNAMAFDHRGNLYVSDSKGSTIYRVATDRTVEVWLYDPTLLAPIPNPTPCGVHPFDPGANGVAFHKGTLYVLNTTQATVVSVPVEPDGSAGADTIFAGPTCDLFGADGQAFDNQDNLYVADNIQNQIVRIDATGTIITTVASGSPPFYSPTAIAFGTTEGTQKTIFITNATILSGPGAVAGIVYMNVDVPGQPLP